MTATPLIIDPWSYYDFKEAFTRATGPTPWTAPTWIVELEDRRRLTAYMMLESYFRLCARQWLNPEAADSDKAERREYGDANLVVNQTLSSLFGSEQNLSVEGALGEEQDEDGKIVGDVKPETLQYYSILDWMTKQRFYQKMIACERDAIKLGDGVYVLEVVPIYPGGESSETSPPTGFEIPKMQQFDPGFFFPVMDPLNDEEYPTKVHIAYEYEDPKDKKKKVRKRTWELVDVDIPYTPGYATEPATRMCIYSDGIWDIMNLGKDKNTLESEAADTWFFQEEPLWIDFIPVVHIPNLVAGSEFWGTSLIANVIQIIDDLIATDTDTQKAGATTGSPPIAVGGAAFDSTKTVQVYGPGTILNIGDGNATVIDTSQGLMALLELRKALLERFSVNVRIPEALLGRVKPSEVPSGLAMALGFAPHTSLIAEMRLVRWEKYGLFFKFAGRLLILSGEMDEAVGIDLAPANMVFGSYLPADKVETMNLVVQGVTSHVISLETGVRMLEQAGIPIDDVIVEIDRIIRRDYAAATEAGLAAADPNYGRQLLGLPALTDAELDETEDDDTGGGAE